jgi:HK97 gp10 family phage protein
MTASMKISGFKEIDALLQSIPRQIAGRGVTAGLRKALQPVAATARSYAPGGLPQTIKIAPEIKAGQRAQSLLKPGSGRRVMYVGSAAPHAHLVEFGTVERFHAKEYISVIGKRGRRKAMKINGKSTGFMTPDPFLRPAWDMHKDEVLANLATAIREEISKATGRRISRAIKAGY